MIGLRRVQARTLRRITALAIAALAAVVAAKAEARPLPETRCIALRNGLERVIQITPAFEMWREEIDLPPLGRQEVCRLSFRGTGVIFERPDRRGFIAAVEAVRHALTVNGWVETPAQSPFAADGPLATRFAVTKARNICVVEVSLRQAARRLGAPDQPIAEWRIMAMPAVQRLYTIRLDCVAPESG